MRTFTFMCEGAVKGSRMFRNNEYTVTRHLADEDGMIMLSISRHADRTHNVSWRDKQAIKNMLVGPEHEAVELFPAESRLMDTANEFWLWVLENKSRRFPVGFHTGRMVSDEAKQQYRGAWESWREQIEGVHSLLLDGERLPPDRVKGLLNREARAKERYDEARRRLLGIEGD